MPLKRACSVMRYANENIIIKIAWFSLEIFSRFIFFIEEILNFSPLHNKWLSGAVSVDRTHDLQMFMLNKRWLFCHFII